MSSLQVSDRIKNLKESATILMASKAREMKQKGIDVISLSLGEPDFNTPDHIRTAAKKAIDDGYSHYTPVPGFLELREAISSKFKRDNGLDYSPDQIVVSTGAKQTLANIMLSVLNPGDEVLLPIPFWVSYLAQIELAGAKPISISSNIQSDFKITADQLRNAITDKSRILLFSSPCNPSGSVYTHEELNSLVEVLKDYPQILVVSDEIYEWINFTNKHVSIGSFESMHDRTITVNGLSKGFAMTGWRLGYMGAPLKIAKACTKMQGQFTSGTNAVTQIAAIEALNGDMTPTLKMKEAFMRRKELVKGLLEEIEGVKVNDPKGAFYFFPDVSSLFGKSFNGKKINNADELCMFILEEGHLSLVTGSAFGNPDCLRISYAASDENLIEAMKRMKTAIEKLK